MLIWTDDPMTPARASLAARSYLRDVPATASKTAKRRAVARAMSVIRQAHRRLNNAAN